MRDNLQAINKNTQLLNERIKEVERLLRQLRDCWEDHRDFVWSVMDHNNVLDPAGRPALSIVASTGRLNSGFEALKALGVLSERVARCEECSGVGLVADPDVPSTSGVTCMQCGGTGEAAESDDRIVSHQHQTG